MALDEYARAEHILRSIFGESDPHIGCIFLHRGDVFACQYAEGADEGVFTLAHSWYDRALENALHTLPEDDAHAIMCRARFGRLYSMAKNEARAMHVMKECLELSKPTRTSAASTPTPGVALREHCRYAAAWQ